MKIKLIYPTFGNGFHQGRGRRKNDRFAWGDINTVTYYTIDKHDKRCFYTFVVLGFGFELSYER